MGVGSSNMSESGSTYCVVVVERVEWVGPYGDMGVYYWPFVGNRLWEGKKEGLVPFFQDYHFGYKQGSYGLHEWSARGSGALMALSYDPCQRKT